MKNLIKLLPVLFLTITMASCSDDDDTPEVVNEEEVITTMTVTLSKQTGGTPITLTSRDDDGDGPNAPVLTVSGPLEANTTYSGMAVFLNETESPAENITEEIEEEDDEHQIFYQAGAGLDATVTYDDMDGDGNPVGLDFTLTTGAASTGTMTVTLIHEPQKDAAGVADGDRTNAGGEEDFTATFTISIQ